MALIFVFFFALMALLAFRIGKDFYLSFQCVDEETLHDFQYGRLKRGGETYRHVIGHLNRCERCRDSLDSLQRGKSLEDHLIDREDL